MIRIMILVSLILPNTVHVQIELISSLDILIVTIVSKDQGLCPTVKAVESNGSSRIESIGPSPPVILPAIPESELGMAFQMVRNFFGQGSPSRSRTHESTVESDSLNDQQGKAHYSLRDVKKSAAESNWSELARARAETEVAGQGSHNCCATCRAAMCVGYVKCLLSLTCSV